MKSFPLRYMVMVVVATIAYSGEVQAIVSYDKGRLEINGIQLFQDSKNEKAYYYLPNYPKLSEKKEGDFEFLCLKYVGSNLQESGGLFHALINFKLSKEELSELEGLLNEKVPGARIMGPVMIQEDPQNPNPSFRIISSVLNNAKDTLFNSNVITSGRAPFLPSSKVAISAMLNTKAATLLWETFESKTSDVSVVVEGYFPALVTGFSATVSANLEMVYDHFSKFQSGGDLEDIDPSLKDLYDKNQIHNILDSLAQSGLINIDIADASKVYDIETTVYQNILDIITNKVTKMMFESQDAWSKIMTTEGTNSSSDSEVAPIVSPIGYHGMNHYAPRSVLKLKSKNAISSFVFKFNLNQSTAIKVPVYSAGNIGGFYETHADNVNYFKVVDMDDPVFQSRDLHFQVNSAHADCFKHGFDNVSIMVKKEYADTLNHPFIETLRFNDSQYDSGDFIRKCAYKGLGEKEWLNYKYKVAWHLEEIDTTLSTAWISTNTSSVSIEPPLERTEITIDLDRANLAEYNIQSARIRFGVKLIGQTKMTKMKVLRKSDAESTDEIVLYHDKDEPVVYQVSWYSKGKEIVDDLKLLEDEYLILMPEETK